jgi:ligand-binding sensor domain-containing protein
MRFRKIMFKFPVVGFLQCMLFLWAGQLLAAGGGRPVHLTYGVNDGLPGEELYDVVQGPEGYIWIASDQGVCRYDGEVFRTFTKRDGLADNTILRLTTDSSGRIWMLGFNGTLSWYFKGRFHAFSGNASLRRQMGQHLIMNVVCDATGRIWIGSKGAGAFSGKLGDTLVSRFHPWEQGQPNHHLEKVGGNILAFSQKPGYSDQLARLGKLHLMDSQSNFFQARPIVLRNGGMALNWENQLYQWNTDGTFRKRKLEHRILDVFEDGKGQLWLGTQEGGVVRMENLTASRQDLFFGETVTGICQDKRGGMWFTTKGNGLHFVPDPDCRTFWAEEDLGGAPSFRYCADGRGNVLVAYDDGGLALCGPDRVTELIPAREKGKWGRVANMINFGEEGTLLSFDRHPPVAVRDGAVLRTFPELVAGRKVFRGNGNTFWMISTVRAVRMRWPEMELLNEYTIPNVHSYALTQLGHDSLLLATRNGLRLYDCRSQSLRPLPADFPVRDRVMWIARRGDRYYLATRGSGLTCLRWPANTGQPEHLFTVGQEQGLCTGFTNHVFPESDSVLWLSTQCGVYKLRLGADWNLKGMDHYDHHDGLASNQVLFTTVSAGRVWVGTSSAISTFVEPANRDAATFPLRIQRMLVDRKDTLPENGHRLPYHQNEVRFVFRTIAFRRPGRFGYEYRLRGLQDEWSYTADTTAVFSGLPAGDYSFEVRVVEDRGKPVSRVGQLEFAVLPPWWERLWFRLLALLALVVAIAGFVLFRLRAVRRKEQLRNRIILLQAQSLRAQMNPHFAFNALGTVQHYITEGAEREALEQLGRFSDLLRLVLRNSEADWIPLAEELKMLGLYLELESLRFEGKFSHRIEIDDSLDVSFDRVPPMILQPFVENAIWHGLRNKEGDCRLWIRLERQGPFAACTIEDNGVGRAFHKDKRKSDHFSMGIGITEKRLAIIRDQNRRKGGVRIEDLFNAAGEPAGTRVHLKIPIN